MSWFENTVRLRAAAGALAAVSAAAFVVGTATAATPPRVALPSSIPGGLAGAASTPADPGLVIPLRVYLAGNAAARVQAALAVSDPRSNTYAHYLTPDQYEKAYGPSQAQIRTVTGWLTSQGMTVTAANQHYIAVTATVAKADAAFGTTLSAYQSANTLAPTGQASIPAALAGDIATVTGLYNDHLDASTQSATHPARTAARTTASARVTASALASGAAPCSRWWGQYKTPIPTAYGHTTAPTVTCGYTVSQLRKAYGVSSSAHTGKGATVAIVLDGHLPTMQADADRFFADEGVAGFAPGQYSESFDATFAATCGSNEDLPEQPLDVETVHIAAPDAKVLYVGADCAASEMGQQQDFLDAMTRIADRHLADVVTESFAVTEQVFTPAIAAAWEPTFQQGALEGIGFDFDSGDFGDGNFGTGQTFVQYPASDPWATAVGGTSLLIGENGTVVGEYGWGDNLAQLDPTAAGYTAPPPGVFESGSNGGRTALGFAQPGYQRGVVPTALATAGGTEPARRVVPDIAADAGMLWQIGYTGANVSGVYGETTQGGTSGAAPIIAGLEADAKQAGGHALGFANPALYRLAGSPAIRDILPVNPNDPPIMVGPQPGFGDGTYLVTLGEDTSLKAARGYDDVTGIGSPAPCFITAIASALGR